MKDSDVVCPNCHGKKHHKVFFHYKNEEFHYYRKCILCRGEGHVDWIKGITKTSPNEFFCDNHPAGSVCIDGTPEQILGGTSVYDGKEYINLETKRGTALYYHFHQYEEEEINE